MSWSAEQYTIFEDERTRPVRDLLAAIPPRAVTAAIDIGCGPGNSTERLLAQYPGASVRGLDSSAGMIEAARARLPQVQFDIADVTVWDERGPFDVILSNAVMQWVPDHATLFPQLVSKLSAGGSLAIQMPNNLDEPAHALMRAVAADGPWAAKLAQASGMRTPMGTAHWFYGLLRPVCTRVDIWQTTYNHVLSGHGAIVEWFKGSGLRVFLDPLDDSERTAYLARYADAVAAAYPMQANGEVLLPFPRLFIVATR